MNRTGLRACYGALVDLVKFSRHADPATYEISDVENISDMETAVSWAHAQEESSANRRAIATIVAGGYSVGIYKEVYFWLDAKVQQADFSDAEIVTELIATFGQNATCQL